MDELLKTDGIIYNLLDEKHVDEAAKLVSKVFCKNEYMTNALKINEDEFYRLAELYCKKATSEKLSVVAIDESGNNIVGAFISEDLMTDEPELKNISKKFEPILCLLESLGSKFLPEKEKFNVNECCHMFLGAVNSEYVGAGIGNRSIALGIEIAKNRGFKYILGEPTGPVSTHLLNKYGFKKLGEIIYTDYRYKGENIFKDAMENSGCGLYLKTFIDCK